MQHREKTIYWTYKDKHKNTRNKTYQKKYLPKCVTCFLFSGDFCFFPRTNKATSQIIVCFFSVLLVVSHFLPRKKRGKNRKYRIPPDFVLFLVVCFLCVFSRKKNIGILELSSITKIFFRYLRCRNPHLKLLVTSSGMIMA